MYSIHTCEDLQPEVASFRALCVFTSRSGQLEGVFSQRKLHIATPSRQLLLADVLVWHRHAELIWSTATFSSQPGSREFRSATVDCQRLETHVKSLVFVDDYWDCRVHRERIVKYCRYAPLLGLGLLQDLGHDSLSQVETHDLSYEAHLAYPDFKHGGSNVVRSLSPIVPNKRVRRLLV